MTKIIESSTAKRPLITRFFVPSPAQVTVDIFVGGLVLVLANVQAIWRSLENLVGYNQQSLAAAIDQGPSWVGGILKTLTSGRVPQIAFWAFMGCVVYVVVWFIRSALVNIRNDIVASKYVSSRPRDSKKYWESILLQKAFLVCSLVVVAGYLFAFIRLLSLLARLCASAASDFQWVKSLPEMIGATFAVAFLLQVLVILGHIVINSWSSINNEL
jgi:hypothetical protein